MRNNHERDIFNIVTNNKYSAPQTLLERAIISDLISQSLLEFDPKKNNTEFSKLTGKDLRITEYNDIIGAGQVLFYNGVVKGLGVGKISTAVKKISYIIPVGDKRDGNDVVSMEEIFKVFDIEKWFTRDEEGNMIPKANVKKGMRYGITVNGVRKSRLDIPNVTKFSIETESGYTQRVNVISTSIIKQWKEILDSIDLRCQTVSDIKLLQEDIQNIARESQKTGIDIFKKYSLVVSIILADYVNKETKLMSSYLKWNGEKVIVSNAKTLIASQKQGDTITDEDFKLDLVTNEVFVEDGGKNWKIIANEFSKVINEKVMPLLINSKPLDEMIELIQISDLCEVNRSFTKYCYTQLKSYRNYAWNVKSSGEDEKIKGIDPKADSHELVRIAFKCNVQRTGRNLGLDDNTILACVIAADCMDNYGNISIAQEKMTGRQLFKHEFASFYATLGRKIKAVDGSIVTLKQEKVFYGETAVYGVNDDILNTLGLYEAIYRQQTKQYQADVLAVINKEEGCKGSIAEIEIPEKQALEVEFVNGYTTLNGVTLQARGMQGRAHLILSTNTKVVAAKEYDPEVLAANETFDGRLIVLDKALCAKSTRKSVKDLTTDDFMGIKYYKNVQAKDSNKFLENKNALELKKLMVNYKKVIERNGDRIILSNTTSGGVENVVCINLNGNIRVLATFSTCGDMDRAQTILGKKVDSFIEANSREVFLEKFNANKNIAGAISDPSVKVKLFEYVAGSAFIITE